MLMHDRQQKKLLHRGQALDAAGGMIARFPVWLS